MPSFPLIQLQPIRQRVTYLLACAWLLALLYPIGATAEDATPLESIQIMTGNYRKGPTVGAIGHLGGVPVSIPKEYAHFVEYDGDPGFLEKRKGPRPERTFASGICSFGFEIRYPDMVPVNDQNWAKKRKDNIHTTMWMRIGVLSNSTYQDRSSDKLALLSTAWLKNSELFHRYEEQPIKVYGLTAHVPVDVDLARREPNSINGGDFYDENVYVFRATNGAAGTFIRCSNMSHAAAPCKHRFGLEPDLKASVDLSYRKGLLPYWREIQDGVTKVLLGFRVDPSIALHTQPRPSQSSPSVTKE